MAASDQSLVFTNVESLLVAFLVGQAELAGTPVVVRLPDGYDGLSRTVVVTRVGGEFATDDLLDRALIRIDTFGPDKTAALDLAGVVRALIWSLPGIGRASGIAVTDVSEDRGPSWLRDPGYATANRYTTRYRLMIQVDSRA